MSHPPSWLIVLWCSLTYVLPVRLHADYHLSFWCRGCTCCLRVECKGHYNWSFEIMIIIVIKQKNIYYTGSSKHFLGTKIQQYTSALPFCETTVKQKTRCDECHHQLYFFRFISIFKIPEITFTYFGSMWNHTYLLFYFLLSNSCPVYLFELIHSSLSAV